MAVRRCRYSEPEKRRDRVSEPRNTGRSQHVAADGKGHQGGEPHQKDKQESIIGDGLVDSLELGVLLHLLHGPGPHQGAAEHECGDCAESDPQNANDRANKCAEYVARGEVPRGPREHQDDG